MPRGIRRFVAIITAVLSSIFLMLIFGVGTVWPFVVIVVGWLAVLVGGYWLSQNLTEAKKQDKFLLAVTTMISFTGLVSLVEWRILQIFLAGLGGLSMLAIYWPLSGEADEVALYKPVRRILAMIWVFDVYALATTIFAVHLFFPWFYFWILMLISGAVFSYLAVMIWRRYAPLPMPVGRVWALLVFFLMSELVWVMHLLPFGYLASGFLLTWLWYVIQLLIRFHFSSEDVGWVRQRWFLFGNGVLYAAVLLLFVRWI